MPLEDKIQSLPAVTNLLNHLDFEYDSGTQQKGKAYADFGAVADLQLNDSSITGSVIGSQRTPYFTCLYYEQGTWDSECDCPVEVNCKHAYALGLVWSQERLKSINDSRQRGGRGLAIPSSPTWKSTLFPLPTTSKKIPFREHWSPILAEEIGRPLTEEENRLLGQLSAAFHQLSFHPNLSHHTLMHHGLAAHLDYLPHQLWKPAFPNWWSYRNQPRDPWELWQYIALHWQQHGRALPAAFAPKTDVESARQSVENLIEQQELESWKTSLFSGLGSADLKPAAADHKLTATYRDLRLVINPNNGSQLQGLPAKAGKPWCQPVVRWLKHWMKTGLSSFDDLPETARALALELRLACSQNYGEYPRNGHIETTELERVLSHPLAAQACVLPDGSPFVIEEAPLELHARAIPDDPKRLRLHLLTPNGEDVTTATPFIHAPGPLYSHAGKVWRGPPPLPSLHLPLSALNDTAVSSHLNTLGLRLPASLAAKFVKVTLRPHVRCWIEEIDSGYRSSPEFQLELSARSDSPLLEQQFDPSHGWQWAPAKAPPPPTADSPHYHFELTAANQVLASLANLKLSTLDGTKIWNRAASRAFVDDFIDWHATLPRDAIVEVTPELRGLVDGPIQASLQTKIDPDEASGLDWFDVSVKLNTGDLTFTSEELRLLLKAKGGWVRLPQRGWQSLQIDLEDTADSSPLADLGLSLNPEDLLTPKTQRYHALQLGKVKLADEDLAQRVRERIAAIRAVPPPPLPANLQAQLRPYQNEGYHYLVHLATLGLGGILADDMGLGKTVQALAWLLWLRDRPRGTESPKTSKHSAPNLRVLVVCPKSVMSNWENETARFAPSLQTGRAMPRRALPDDVNILVVNYTQLRLRAEDLRENAWDAIVLDEGQNIKNPGSATARAAYALKSRHRIVLSGTPIENRLLDLWSLFAFAQPGLLGTQTDFKRLYRDQDNPDAAHTRLAKRVRPFMLRRTKGQVARDLPARTEEVVTCELEGPQRTLYDAELKRARQLLLGVDDPKAFNAARFNILQSLLRLRQICCDPRLISPTMAKPSSAKLEALLDTLEPLIAQGHRVLVFSQFVGMLELIRDVLKQRDIDHLMLTGQTENRQDLVDTFQSPTGPPVFLLSLKAAGSGLNLTAASYVVLYDPWWNPAVEAQAIDRTHRIGQTSPVIAYRLIAKNTIEEKIRTLQSRKSAMAATVVQEESLAKVMDLETLRDVLS